MSFKRLSNPNVLLTPYTANKQYDVSYNSFTLEGIKIYTGQKVTGPFNTSTDPITTDNRYRRLVYESVNHKFYQNFSGSYIDTGSSVTSINYQNLSIYRPSCSYYNYKDVRATGSLPDAVGNTVKVIEMPTTIVGEGLSKGSVVLTSEYYKIWDDNYGNLLGQLQHIPGEGGPDEVFPTLNVGNVIYGQGVLVITNQTYQSYFDFTEPTTTTTSTTTTTTTTPAPTTTTTSTTTSTTTPAPTTTTTTTTVPTTTSTTTTTTTVPTTTTSTTTTTTTAASGLLLRNSVALFGETIEALEPASSYTGVIGSFPLNVGEQIRAILGSDTTEFAVTCVDGSTLSIYKNASLVQSIFTTATGFPLTYTFNPITYTSSDLIFIELT